MSRSYKKTPYCGDESSKKYGKKRANVIVRRRLNKDLDFDANNSLYKRVYEQWDICDYYSIRTFPEYLKLFVYDREDGLYHSDTNRVYTKEQLYERWCSFYKRK